MLTLKGTRLIAPSVHASLFVLASVVMLISDEPILNGPGRVHIGILWVADLPISAVAFAVMFFSATFGWLFWVLWGVIGTVWWYLLGISIESWGKRLSKRPKEQQE